MKINGKIVLASKSPRRLSLLKSIGINVEVCEPKCSEILDKSESPNEFTLRVSKEKGFNVHSRLENTKDTWIVSADTTVLCRGKILNKPANEKEAKEMLEMMSGKTHKVVTSFSIIPPDSKEFYTETVESFVTFRNISSKEIEWYVESGEPLDKAGAYGAQGLGTIFIEKIDGSYTNVVGLPLSQLILALMKLGALKF